MKRALALLLALGLSHRAWALGQENFVSETSHTGDFPLAGAVVAVDSADWPGVARAAGDLRSDLAAVFGKGAGAGRTILVEKSNSATTVLWNPWSDLAARLPDLPDDAWPHFVCVETANTATDAITLQPNQTHTMQATVTALPTP